MLFGVVEQRARVGGFKAGAPEHAAGVGVELVEGLVEPGPAIVEGAVGKGFFCGGG